MTPTEDLIIQVLTARYRLGENFWTFESRHHKALASLEQKGLINVVHGVIDRTLRANLTDLGKRAFLDSNYLNRGE